MLGRRFVVMLLAMALVLGCSGGDDDGGGGGRADGGTDARGGQGVETVADALRVLPDDGEEQQTILWGDLARAAEIAGVQPPDDPADAEAVDAYLTAVTLGQGAVVPPEAAQVGRQRELPAFVDDVGWSVLQADRFVERQQPPDVVTVLEGDFDDGALDDALGQRSDGLWVAGDPDLGEFGRDLRNITPARPLGQTQWLGLDGRSLTVAHNPRTAAAARAALAGEDGGTVMGDDESLAALGRALDAHRPHGALLVRPGRTMMPSVGDRGLTPERLRSLCEEALPEPTLAAATGVADDGGPVMLVALAHASDASARANAEALERIATTGSTGDGRPWSELVTVEGVETTEDAVVLARLRPVAEEGGPLWYRPLQVGDPLVSSC